MSTEFRFLMRSYREKTAARESRKDVWMRLYLFLPFNSYSSFLQRNWSRFMVPVCSSSHRIRFLLCLFFWNCVTSLAGTFVLEGLTYSRIFSGCPECRDKRVNKLLGLFIGSLDIFIHRQFSAGNKGTAITSLVCRLPNPLSDCVCMFLYCMLWL